MPQLSKECVILEMEAANKEEALEELAARVHVQHEHINPEQLLALLQDREQIGSTGIGNGVAIPHAKIPELNSLILCFGRSRKGVEFEAIDRRPVHLFVQIISPAGMSREYLQTLARISRLLKPEANRASLLAAESEEEILALFNAAVH